MAPFWESWIRPSPIHRYQNRFCTPTLSWRNLAHKLWRSKAWRTNWQTDKKLKCFCRPGGGWNLSPTKLGMVIEDIEHVLAAPKLLCVRCTVSPVGALKIWGNPTSDENETWRGKANHRISLPVSGCLSRRISRLSAKGVLGMGAYEYTAGFVATRRCLWFLVHL